MSLGNHRNLVIVVGVVVALLAATALLAGYANIVPAGSDADSQVKACQAKGGGAGCPMMAGSATCPKLSAADQAATGCCPTPCPIPCPKPCCAGQAEGGCCGTSTPAGCCAGATESANQ